MKHIVLDIESEVRLRVYLQGIFPNLTTNSAIKKAIEKGEIKVNGESSTTGYKVCNNDIISYEPNLTSVPPPFEIPVHYQDEHFAILEKPPGLISSGNKRSTLANYLPHLLDKSNEKDALPKPLLVHRLDKATSGLIIAAKTASSRIALGDMLANGDIEKKYVAIVQGLPTDLPRLVDSPIDGKKAITIIASAKLLSTPNKTSFVTIGIKTGRTHQIRKHMNSIRHPLVGDPIYNEKGLTFGKGLFLAAVSLTFIHPITNKKMTVSTEPPKKFKKYMPWNMYKS